MPAVIPLGPVPFCEDEVGFVDQRRRAQRLPRRLIDEFLRRKLTQFVIDLRDDRIG